MKTEYHIFLGGIDEEMMSIKKLAEEKGFVIHDKNLSWGAKASDYGRELWAIQNHNDLLNRQPINQSEITHKAGMQKVIKHPVLIELEQDINIISNHTVLDHHGDKAGKPPAIIQFCNYFGVTPTREHCLIGAMDAAYIHGLRAIGATNGEIARFLNASPSKTLGQMLIENERLDNITVEQAASALEKSEKIGEMVVVKCKHSKTAPITARLIDKQQKQNVLIISDDGELNYYGPGEAVKRILEKYPNGWSGGSGLCKPDQDSINFWTKFGGYVPDTAFYGCAEYNDELVNYIIRMAS